MAVTNALSLQMAQKEVPFGEAVIVSEALTEAPSNYKSIA